MWLGSIASGGIIVYLDRSQRGEEDSSTQDIESSGRLDDDERTRFPEFLDSECLGDACPNFAGEPCHTTETEWLSAKAPTSNGQDTTKPPLLGETDYIIYGQRCNESEKPKMVAQSVYIFKPENVSMASLMAITGRHGEMPVFVRGSKTKSDLMSNPSELDAE